MKLITFNHYQIHVTLMTVRSLGQRSRSLSDGHRNPVNSIAPESLKAFEPISHSRAQNDLVFKVMHSKVKVTETFSGKGIRINGSPSTSLFNIFVLFWAHPSV